MSPAGEPGEGVKPGPVVVLQRCLGFAGQGRGACGSGCRGGSGVSVRSCGLRLQSPRLPSGWFHGTAAAGDGRRRGRALLRLPSAALAIAESKCQAMPDWERSFELMTICYHRGEETGSWLVGQQKMRSKNQQLQQSMP